MTRVLIIAALAASSSVAAAQGVAVSLTEFKIQVKPDTVSAGRVTFQLKNVGVTSHGFNIKGPDVDKESAAIPKGQAATMTVTLKPGTYEIWCPMSEGSHKLAGMAMKFTVTAAAAPVAPKKPPR